MGGPPPKREAGRRRRNKDAVEVTSVDLDSLVSSEVLVPTPEERWHPIARLLFDSATQSGQAIFYEPSDWAAVMLLCEQVDRSLQPVPVMGEDGPVLDPETNKPRMMTIPIPGATLNAITKLMGSLMMTEGDRRRVRIELERKKQRDALLAGEGTVVSITKNRADLFKQA